MKSTGLAFQTPLDFLDFQAVYLSAPTDLRIYERGVLPVSEMHSSQCLFGYEAQLNLFAAALRGQGIDPRFLPAPDIFTSTESFRYLVGTGLGGQVSSEILHLTFGMSWATRILRGATNLAVSAGVTSQLPVQFQHHPFASGYNFPAAVNGVLAYHPLQAQACTPDGCLLPISILDTAFSDDSSSGVYSQNPTDSASEIHLMSDCVAQSILEFTAKVWSEKSTGTNQLIDFRRALMRRKALLPRQAVPIRFVLVPWNLENGRSIVPDLIQRLSSGKERDINDLGVIVLPFNEQIGGYHRIQNVANECRTAADSCCASTMFVMRINSLKSIPALRSIVTYCWIDGTDPEWQWNVRRLAQLGFASLLISEPGMEEVIKSSPERANIKALFPAENRRVILSDDQFGEHTWRTHSLSLRGMRRLLQYTRKAGADNGLLTARR